MTGRTLIPCAQCARHVRSSEPSCPFCGAEPPALERVRAPAAFARGSSRAAAFALRAALVAASAGCAAAHDPDDDADSPGAAGADARAYVDAGASHDAQINSDARVADAGHNATDARVPDAAQQGTDARVADAASEASARDATLDAPDEDAFVPIPLYGGVFPDPRTRAKV